MQMKKFVRGSTAALALVAGSAQAAGYGVDTQAARATGMATAVTAQIDDASAVFYNPAGIARGEGAGIYLGDTLIIPNLHVTDSSGRQASTLSSVVPPPHAYLYLGLTDSLSVGLGLFVPYGSAVRWPNDWFGNQLLTKVSLVINTINPEVAYRVGNLRVGAGVQIDRGTVELDKNINFGDSVGGVKLAAGGWGVGGNVGVQYDILPDNVLSVGATYRSPVQMNLNGGNAHFSNIPADFQSTFSDQHGSTKLTIPETVSLGFGYRPMEKMRLGLDAVYTGWQRFQSLDIMFDNPALSTSQPKNWKHSINYHLGGEYALTDILQVRLGVLYDPTPVPDSTVGPELPDSNRLNLTAGLGYFSDGIRADIGYQHIILMSRDSTNPILTGKYNGTAEVIGLSLGYQL